MGHSVLVTAPAVVAISTDDAKDHLRVTHSDEDSYIDLITAAALGWCENFTNSRMITQTWDLFHDAFPGVSGIRLPGGRLQSVTSVKYTASDDSQTTVATSVYDVATWERPGRIVLSYGQCWPTATLRTTGGVEVQYVVGYGDAATDIPEPLIQAMKLTIGHLYNNRESIVVDRGSVQVIEVPDSAKALAWPYRIVNI